MKTRFILLLFMSGIHFSCDKSENEEFIGRDQPQMPASFGFDINDDELDDISFSYSSGIWDGVGDSGGFMSLEISPTQDNNILMKRDDEDYPLILFSKPNDTIFKSVAQPMEWVGEINAYPLFIYGNSDNRWPLKWSVEKGDVLNPCYLGIKVKMNNISQLGWLKLKIDISSGNIEIIDHQIDSGDYLVINR